MGRFSIFDNPVRRYAERIALIFIAVSAVYSFPNQSVYFAAFCVPLILLIIKDARVVTVGLCIGGQPFFALFANISGFSITMVVIAIMCAQVAMMASTKKARNLIKTKVFEKYLLWMSAVFVLIAVSFFLSPESSYNTYYLQFFIIYSLFSCLSGLLIVQSSMKLEGILTSLLLFFACVFPLFDFTLLKIPSGILYSSIGLRGEEGMDAIGLGRVSGSLLVISFLVLIGYVDQRNGAWRYTGIFLVFFITLPFMWFIQTRQAMVAAVVTMIFSVSLTYMSGSSLARGRRLSLLLIFVTSAWLLFFLFNWAVSNLAQSRVTEIYSDDARLDGWVAAWEGITMSPIQGYGLGGYYMKYSMWPHGWVIEAWYDYGVIGLLFFVVPIFLATRQTVFSSIQWRPWMLLGSYWIMVAQLSADIPRNTILFLFFTIAFFSYFSKEIVQ